MGQDGTEYPELDDNKWYAVHLDEFEVFLPWDPFKCGEFWSHCTVCRTGAQIQAFYDGNWECVWSQPILFCGGGGPVRIYDITGPYDSEGGCEAAEF